MYYLHISNHSNSLFPQTSWKPPLTPKKRKQKEPEVEAVESADDDLYLDTSKPTKQRNKKQLKLQGAPIHPKVKTNKAKKTPTLGVEPGSKSKKTPEQMESDNSSPRAEGPKVKHFTLTLEY